MFSESTSHTKVTTLVTTAVLLLSVGTLVTFSGNLIYLDETIKHIIFSLFGIIIFLLTYMVSYRILLQEKMAKVFFVGSNILLAGVLVFGKTINGAKSWYALGFLSFQPTDLVKIGLIWILSFFLAHMHTKLSKFEILAKSSFFLAIPAFLIMMQPDFGSFLVLGIIWFGMLFVSGLKKRFIFGAFFSVVCVSILAWFFLLAPYQKDRITSFVYNEKGSQANYNVSQSIIAIGSGGFFGKGLAQGSQARLGFLPEPTTDFAFATFIEEWGFFGAGVVLSLLLFLLTSIIAIGYRARDTVATLFCYGIALWFGFHILVNVWMNVGMMPVTGIPLPFVSYGGSHVIAELFALGIVAGISKHSNLSRKEDKHIYSDGVI
jgi:rod shape determining protein RodA